MTYFIPVWWGFLKADNKNYSQKASFLKLRRKVKIIKRRPWSIQTASGQRRALPHLSRSMLPLNLYRLWFKLLNILNRFLVCFTLLGEVSLILLIVHMVEVCWVGILLYHRGWPWLLCHIEVKSIMVLFWKSFALGFLNLSWRALSKLLWKVRWDLIFEGISTL